MLQLYSLGFNLKKKYVTSYIIILLEQFISSEIFCIQENWVEGKAMSLEGKAVDGNLQIRLEGNPLDG